MATNQIIDSIHTIMATKTTNNIFICQVVDYNPDENTVSAKSIGSDSVLHISDIHLNTQICDGFTLIPATDSLIFVMKNPTDNQYYMISTSDLAGLNISVVGNITLHPSVCVISATTSLQVSSSQTTFNEGANSGLCMIKELTEKLNNLENIVNDLINKYNGHTHKYIPGTATPVFTNIPSITEPNTLTLTQPQDIENPLIKH